MSDEKINANVREKIYEYIQDVENPELNYNLALEYKSIGQTAAALSFFLRAADRSDDNYDLAYECLIHIGECFDIQGKRLTHAYGCFRQAMSLLPKRPEAYYYFSRVKNWNNIFEDAYYHSSIALDICDFDNIKPLRNLPHYTGKECLLFEKALSSWHWGKVGECKSLLLDLYENHWNKLSFYQQTTVLQYLKKHYSIDLDNISNNIKGSDKIPVIGVPIVNGVNWIKRLIDSVDYPVKDFVIINNNGKGEIDQELDELITLKHKFIDRIKVTHLPSNIGCGGAWNLIIKSYMKEPYWFIATHDIEFSPGMLEAMYKQTINTDYGMIHAKKSDWGGGAYDIFVLKDWVVKKCGLFDENLYPAYAEDVDYYIRTKNESIPVRFLDIEYLHGGGRYDESGAQTWRVDSRLKEKIDRSRILNETKYLTNKWGIDYKSLNTFKKPFNNLEFSTSHTTYDLNFVREKHLGF